MSRKNTLTPTLMRLASAAGTTGAEIDATSMAADITSAPVNIEFLDNIAIQLIQTGTPTGSFVVETSLDYVPSNLSKAPKAGNWDSVTLPTPITVGAGSQTIDLNQVASSYIRIRYIFTSGTGALTAYIAGKAV